MSDPDRTLEANLREASRLTDLSDPDRLSTKIDMSSRGIEARLREASELLELCWRLADTRPRSPT